MPRTAIHSTASSPEWDGSTAQVHAIAEKSPLRPKFDHFICGDKLTRRQKGSDKLSPEGRPAALHTEAPVIGKQCACNRMTPCQASRDYG
jgi:hypothetical protein